MDGARAFSCPSGPTVANETMCSYFFYYGSESVTPDARITSRVKLGTGERVRNIALIIGISSYPNFSTDQQLPAAANDVEHLKTFLKDDEKFDEVIVLQNADATKDNIRYFLEDYILQRAAQFNNKARILIAYSGHGVQAVGGYPPAIVLSNATSLTDGTHAYPLSLIRTEIENLAGVSFQALALINACFGGNVFAFGIPGGNLSDSYSPGTYALTAGADNQLVYSLGGSGDGSIFFDTLIQGVRNGQASPYPIIVVGSDKQSGGVVSLGALNEYLVEQIQALNGKNPPPPSSPFSVPWIGPIMPAPQRALGGFFFLSPVLVTAHGFAPTKPVVSSVAFGQAVSSIPGRPDIKVFNAPTDYLVRGVDVSHYSSIPDWQVLAKANFNFAYVKATQSNNLKDEKFSAYWEASRAAKLDHGAYHVMGFCTTVEQQLQFIKATVPKESDALPFAIDPEFYLPGWGPPAESACAHALGKPEIQNRVLQLAQGVRDYYGKVPLIYAPRQAFADFQSDHFLQYMIWLASYRKGAPPDVGLPGKNPWTLWQYTDDAKIEGLKDVNASVFFGSPAQYQTFKQGKTNLGLAVAVQ